MRARRKKKRKIMETKAKKIFKHPFLDKHTILGAIVLSVTALLASQILFGTIGGEIYNLISGTRDYDSVGYDTGLYLGVIAGALIILAIFKRWFYPEYEGAFKGGRNVLRWSILAFAIPACLLIFNLVTDPGSMGMPSLIKWIIAIMAGVCEESIYRGLNASYIMRQTVTQKKILPAMLVSSLVFGMIHITNLMHGAPLVMTLLQIFSAFVLGLFLCALFLRSGSLIPGMIFHAFYDIIALTDTTSIGDDGAFKPTATVSTEDLIFMMVARVFYLALTIYLTRPAVREEIYEIWSKKWHKNVTEDKGSDTEEATEGQNSDTAAM